jgi:cystathionine beta-lyase/cystathionine gamma-synthase
MRFSTRAIHVGDELENPTGTVVVPIYQVSTFKQSQPDTGAGYMYSRAANLTRTALESRIPGRTRGGFQGNLPRFDIPSTARLGSETNG